MGWYKLRHSDVVELPVSRRLEGSITHQNAVHTTTSFITSQHHLNSQTKLHTQFIMSTTVSVQNISAQTTEKEVRDFFSFW
jgi:hypothetical protein